MKKHLLLLFMFLFSVVGLIAQDRTITGKVTSVEDDLGLPGVSVLVKGTTHGTVTDLDGNYNLKNVSSDDVLEFSFVGFEKQEIKWVIKIQYIHYDETQCCGIR